MADYISTGLLNFNYINSVACNSRGKRVDEISNTAKIRISK